MTGMEHNRIEDCLARLRQKNRAALIPFIVAGDPDMGTTREMALTLLDAGADLLEIGVPFSDPSADGPVIMAADTRALRNGVRLDDCFTLVRELRSQTDAPLILLLYYNLVYQKGVETFFECCRASGVDGVIIPDLPPEEQDEAAPAAGRWNVLMTRLVTPLSGGRLPEIIDGARGFLYCVSSLGVTGERNALNQDLESYRHHLRDRTSLPLALGFGISTPEQARSLAAGWDALIIGSAIVRRIAEGAGAGLGTAALCRNLAGFCQSLRQAMDEGRPGMASNDPGASDGLPPAYPSADEFRRLAGDYRLVPVIRRLMADLATPISLFQRFDDHTSAWLLESVLGGERWARYSIMGRKPLFRVSCKNGVIRVEPGENAGSAVRSLLLQITGQAELPPGGKIIRLIRDLVKACRIPPELSDQGFRCGLVGYFAYDFIRYLERLPDGNPDGLNLPDCDLMAPGEVLLYDHLKSELTLICNQLTGPDPDAAYREAEASLDDLSGVLSADASALGEPPGGSLKEPVLLDFQSNVSRDDYIAQIRQARQYIRQGDIFQVVLSQRFTAGYTGGAFSVYRALRHVNPSPYLFFIRLPAAVLVGASPEMLVRLTGRTIETCPIAGTRRRGATQQEDDALAGELLSDDKELAEHAMLVDLARNDIGRISRFGTVKVRDFCHVERFSHVMHLVSLVEGELREDCSSIDVLAALLPAGTLSGAPKVRAMEIIDELETSRRGPYGGAIGYLGFDGSLDTCITIRTAVLCQDKIHVQAGAGIVADSIPENEYDESVSKAMALFTAIRKAGDFR